MNVIVKEDTRLGSGMYLSVLPFDIYTEGTEQLRKLIDKEKEWLTSDGAEIEEESVDIDEAHIFCGDYSIWFFIREVRSGN